MRMHVCIAAVWGIHMNWVKKKADVLYLCPWPGSCKTQITPPNDSSCYVTLFGNVCKSLCLHSLDVSKKGGPLASSCMRVCIWLLVVGGYVCHMCQLELFLDASHGRVKTNRTYGTKCNQHCELPVWVSGVPNTTVCPLYCLHSTAGIPPQPFKPLHRLWVSGQRHL